MQKKKAKQANDNKKKTIKKTLENHKQSIKRKKGFKHSKHIGSYTFVSIL
jgi:hypothetical protein